MVIISMNLLAWMRKSICFFLSCSSRPILVLMLNGIFMIHESFFIIDSVVFLSFSNALHHPVFMTFLLEHHIFSSIPEKTNSEFMVHGLGLFSDPLTLNSELFRYLVWISAKHFISISSFPQNICAITGDCFLSVKRCLITPGGLMTYPSAFMNSVRRINSYFFSQYFWKISFVIWRKAQSVNPSMGARPIIIGMINVK